MDADRIALADAFGKLRDLADDIRYSRHSPEVLAATARAIAEEVRYAETAALRHDAGAAMRERCAQAALQSQYGAPSTWPEGCPVGWRRRPDWPADRRPTPSEAAWHDNGARDAYIAIRSLPLLDTKGDAS